MASDSREAPDPGVDPTRTDVTREVGDEGGSPGDVESGVDRAPQTGSEAGSTVEHTNRRREWIRRDDTGSGRRSP